MYCKGFIKWEKDLVYLESTMTCLFQEPRKKPSVELPEFSVMSMLPKILKF